MTENKYGKLINRIKAILVDFLVLIGLALAISGLIAQFQDVSNVVRAFAFIFIFLLYDPLMTTLNGATIGHMIMGLKIRQAGNEMKKISFINALIRFVIKAFLGWLSLLTISEKNRGRAIHDSAAGTVVLQS